MAELVIDLYSGSYVRARVVDHTPVDGVPFEVVCVLATADNVGPGGEVFASVNALVTQGGTVWYDAGGTLGHVHNGDSGVDMTANAMGNRITSGDTFTAVAGTDGGSHPILTLTTPAPPVEPPPVVEPEPVPLPITGADIARAIGLPGTTDDLDALARTACEWLAPYLDPAKIIPPDYPGPIREACLVIALDVYQNRTAAGGESIGYDVSAGPYRMGGALWGRVAGLVGPWAAQGSEVG